MDLDIGKRKELVRYARLFKALSDENRLRMIELVAEKEYCATDLHKMLNRGQSVFSHHMKKLTDADIIDYRKSGKWVYYSIDNDTFAIIKEFLDRFSD